jgi:hypothetical protein
MNTTWNRWTCLYVINLSRWVKRLVTKQKCVTLRPTASRLTHWGMAGRLSSPAVRRTGCVANTGDAQSCSNHFDSTVVWSVTASAWTSCVADTGDAQSCSNHFDSTVVWSVTASAWLDSRSQVPSSVPMFHLRIRYVLGFNPVLEFTLKSFLTKLVLVLIGPL